MLWEDNYHAWKQKIELVLAYFEVDDAVLKDNTFQTDSHEFLKWKQNEKMPRTIISLFLFDHMLEHDRECKTA